MLTAVSSITPLIALVGGSGFIGTAIAEAFAAAGWRIVAVGRRPENARHLKPLGDLGQIDARRGDVRDPASLLRALRGADAVVNLVGILEETRRLRFADIHVTGARNVAKAAAAAGAKVFVHVSALGANADANWGYARSKGEGEAAVRAVIPDASIIRPGIAFGPRDDFTNRIAATIAALPSPVMPVIAPETRLQPVYVHDIAAAVLRIVRTQTLKSQPQTYELVGAEILSMRELIGWLAEAIGQNRPLVDTPDCWARLLARFDFLPGAPITADQLAMLQHDSVASGACPGLAELGITPSSLEATAPDWLVRYRVGGRFAVNG